MLWRLLRIGSAPYFVLGSNREESLRLRVGTPWDWRQAFRFRRFDVDTGIERHRLGMHTEDLLATDLIGRVDHDASVEAARTQQRGVEHLGTVRGRQHDDAFGAGEPVHLGEDLVERLLALVVAAAEPGSAGAARAADRVELVDEDDRRRCFLGLLEQVANP